MLLGILSNHVITFSHPGICDLKTLKSYSCKKRPAGLEPTPSVCLHGCKQDYERPKLSRRRMALQIGLLTASHPSIAANFNAEFYAEWPYAQPKDILPYVFENSQRGDLGAIISAIDEFGDYYPMYKCGDEKGIILETLVKDVNPKHVVELGTFLGYSAVRMNSQLQKGAQFITVEAKKENAEVARSIIEYAGFGDQVCRMLPSYPTCVFLPSNSFATKFGILAPNRKVDTQGRYATISRSFC